MKKILVLGDYVGSPYHPFTGVDEEIKSIIGDAYEVVCTGNYNSILEINDYDLFISYTDCWKNEPIDDEKTASLLSYVALGGKMLVIHCGISLQTRSEIAQMMGAKFLNHPKKTILNVQVIDEKEVLTKNISSFETFEEPYRFEFEKNSELTFITNYVDEGEIYRNSWKKKFGKGEIVFLMNGHCADNFKENGNRILIKNSVEYLLSK